MTVTGLPLQRSRFAVSTILAGKRSKPIALDGVCEVVLPKLQRTAGTLDQGLQPHLILRRGVTRDPALVAWWRETLAGIDILPRTVTISVLAADDQVAVKWTISAAIPEAFSYSTLNALNADVLIESLELSFERADIDMEPLRA
jgi:hypothetical protein